MQRLARAGFVTALRGSRGGFRLKRPSNSITLLNVFETIEGKIETSTCLVGAPVCSSGKCILGNLLESINSQVRSYLSRTRLSDLESFRENQMF
jgi:Rrf2 family protein